MELTIENVEKQFEAGDISETQRDDLVFIILEEEIEDGLQH